MKTITFETLMVFDDVSLIYSCRSCVVNGVATTEALVRVLGTTKEFMMEAVEVDDQLVYRFEDKSVPAAVRSCEHEINKVIQRLHLN